MSDNPNPGAAPAPAAAPVAPPAPGAAPPAAPAAASPPAATPPAAPQPGAPADYWPEGLDPQYRGQTANETLDNLAKGLKGYRDRDAARDVPKEAAGYSDYASIKGLEISEAEKPYFDALKEDIAFKPMAEQALKEGVDRGALARIYKAGLKGMGEAGFLLPVVDEAAERAAMLPEAAKNLSEADQNAAIDRRIGDAAGFLKLASETMGLPKEAAAYGDAMLTDRAAGLQLIEWAKAQAQKGGAQPGAAPGQGGGDTAEGLRAEMAALNRSDPDYQKKSEALEARYRKLYS